MAAVNFSCDSACRNTGDSVSPVPYKLFSMLATPTTYFSDCGQAHGKTLPDCLADLRYFIWWGDSTKHHYRTGYSALPCSKFVSICRICIANVILIILKIYNDQMTDVHLFLLAIFTISIVTLSESCFLFQTLQPWSTVCIIHSII